MVSRLIRVKITIMHCYLRCYLRRVLILVKALLIRRVKKIGIEDVSVSAKGSGDDTQVELSGYITPSVQVSYRVGVFEAMNEIAIRYRVFSKLYIEATSGLYDSIDLLYQFDWGSE
ncbi:hypothetical protein D9981_18595 [Pseudoalteromonas phenolica O-BC30]|nr:hypothetical protein D9981_18595 [Pseudoalteromonas phenolica O-BC30]